MIWSRIPKTTPRIQPALPTAVAVRQVRCRPSKAPPRSRPRRGLSQLSPSKRLNSLVLRNRTPQNMDSSAARRLSSETRKKIRKDYINKAADDLDMGPLDTFKTFTLFPVLAKLQYSDHVARVIFPVAFAAFLFSAFDEADWFGPHYELLRSSTCYSRYS